MAGKNVLLYSAGAAVTLTYPVSMDLYRAKIDEGRGTMLARYVEFWCQKNCFDDWRVEVSNRVLVVSFTSTVDTVLFQLSEEFSYFVPRATKRPRPPTDDLTSVTNSVA